MTNVVAAIVFGLVVGAALTLMRGAPRRAAVNRFLAYVLVVSFGAGLTQVDLWPFSAWPLVAGRVADVVTHPRLVGVDRSGTEHDIDPRAWHPIGYLELNSFVNRRLPVLDGPSRDTVGAWLLAKAERARARAARGESIDGFDRFLGPFAAPFFILAPHRWAHPERAPRTPLVGVRLYRESWDPEARARGEATVRRELVYQFPRAP